MIILSIIKMVLPGKVLTLINSNNTKISESMETSSHEELIAVELGKRACRSKSNAESAITEANKIGS